MSKQQKDNEQAMNADNQLNTEEKKIQLDVDVNTSENKPPEIEAKAAEINPPAKTNGTEYEFEFNLIKNGKTFKTITAKANADTEADALIAAQIKLIEENPDITVYDYTGKFRKITEPK